MARHERTIEGNAGQTDKLITKTGTLAENAGKQADRTKDLADEMKDQAVRTKTIAEQAVIQANAAKVVAESAVKSLVQSETTVKVSNRAYLGMKDATIRVGTTGQDGVIFNFVDPGNVLQLTNGIVVEMHLVNTGNTPAVATHGWADIGVMPGLPAIDSVLPKSPDADRRPSGVRDVPKDGMVVYTLPRALSQEELQYLNTGRRTLIMWGATSYLDTFGDAHETSFCVWYDIRGHDMASCPVHNHMK